MDSKTPKRPARFNPKKHKDQRRKNRVFTTSMLNFALRNPGAFLHRNRADVTVEKMGRDE